MTEYFLPILAVFMGVGIVLATNHKKTTFSKLLLSFSGAFLLAVTLFNLLPEVYEHLDKVVVGTCIMGGILIQIILEFFSKGAEHGHIHLHGTNQTFPWMLFLSLCLHSFLEGFPIHHHETMVYGVFIHKIPIAMLITTFLVHAQFSRFQIIIFLSVFAIMTPLGTLVSYSGMIPLGAINYINALVIGIFLHISTTILFESNQGHSFNLTKLLSIIFGFVLAYFI